MKATILLLPIYLINAVNVQNAYNSNELITRDIEISTERIEILDTISPKTQYTLIDEQDYTRIFQKSTMLDSIPMGQQTTTAYFLEYYNKETKITRTELLVIQEITPYNYVVPQASYNYMEGYNTVHCEFEMETGSLQAMPIIADSNVSIYSQLTHQNGREIQLEYYDSAQDQGEEIDNEFIDTRTYGTPTKIYWYIKGTTTEETNETAKIYLEIQSKITYTPNSVIVVEGQEIIDLPGLMLQILAMPFAFISQAFNLTLFPGTAYQVNIANTLLVIIGILVLFVILKIVLKIFL